MYDAIVIGSGFGGAMAAHRLVHAGWRVLLLERGDWVPRGPEAGDPRATLVLGPYYSKESAYQSGDAGISPDVGSVFCVGGPSVFYGGTSFRFRIDDFAPPPEIVGTSGAAWPFDYHDLEASYGESERLLGISGEDGDDPTRPPRSTPYPQPPPRPAAVSEVFRDAARSLGLNPFPLPLAINFSGTHGHNQCVHCRTCDTYACKVDAKNDTGTAVVAALLDRGLELRTQVAVTRLVADGRRITEVQAVDRARGERVSFRARYVILAAGALATPHLLLASGLDRLNPAGRAVGAFLMRHCSAMTFGFCNFRPDPAKVFHKNFAVLDYYFGDPKTWRHRQARIGSIQQITTPPAALMKSGMPRWTDPVPMGGFCEHLTSALVIAEDEPRASNRVFVDPSAVDAVGLPRLRLEHRYTRRDASRRRMLVRRAKRILRRCGAWSFYTYNIKTFSHALGTVRMGVDPASSPLDGSCRFRGLENLLVVDGSTFPTSAAVNPSLTIAAIALRAADRLVTGDSS